MADLALKQDISLPDEYAHYSVSEKRLLTILAVIVLTILPLLTFTFGGVHETVYLPVQALLFFAGFLNIGFIFKKNNQPHSLYNFALISGFGLLLWFCLQYLLLTRCSLPHPVLSAQICHPAPADAFRTTLFFASCIIFFLVLKSLFSHSNTFLRQALIVIWGLTLIVTLIALSHWFYDSGKLFWRFAPDYVFPSNRARWPFVNSNHLGHFLILTFFLLFGLFRISNHSFQELLFSTPRFSEQPLLRILPRPRYLYPLIRLCFQSLLLIACLLSIAATLSRSSWIGLMVGAIIIIIFTIVHRNSLPELPVPPAGLRKPSRRRKSNKSSESRLVLFRKRLTYLFYFSTVILFCFFLFTGRGVEKIEGRVEYGLASSKEDIRWTLYTDSIHLLRKAPFVGSGISSWNTIYPQVMSTELANVNPEYLHSDPYQFVIEAGTIGSIPVVFLFLLVTTKLLTAPPKNYACILAHSLYAGIVSFLVASCFDFPFRIPAISYLFILLLALLLYLLDSKDDQPTVESKLAF